MLLLPVFHPMPYPMYEAIRTPLIRSAINPTMRRRLRVAKPRSKAAGVWLVLPPCSASRSTGSGSLGSPSPFSSARRENLLRREDGAVRVPGGLSGFCIFTIRRVAVAKRPNKSCQATTGADATSTCKVLAAKMSTISQAVCRAKIRVPYEKLFRVVLAKTHRARAPTPSRRRQ